MGQGLIIKPQGLVKQASGKWGSAIGNWLPSQIVGVQYLWRGDYGITLEVGSVVSHWLDMIVGMDAVQVDNAKRPAWKTGVDGINGQPAVQGDGNDDFLLTAAFTAIEQPFTVWVVMTIGHRAVCGTYSDAINGNTTTSVICWQDYVNDYYSTHFGTSLASASGTLAAEGSTIFYLLELGATDSVTVNGVLEASGNAGAGNLSRIRLFERNNGTYPYDGLIAELGIVSGAISAADQANLEAYVQSRYGIAAW